MFNLFKNILVVILCLFVASCFSSNNLNTTKNNNKFSTKSIEQKEPDFPIEIISKSESVPIEVEIKRDYPENLSIDSNGMLIKHIERKPLSLEKVKKGEINKIRSQLISTWKSWYNDMHSKLRLEIKKEYKNHLKKLEDDFKLRSSFYNKKSDEYKNLQSKYKSDKDSFEAEYKKVQKTLKQKHKEAYSYIKEYINNYYPKNKNYFRVNSNDDFWTSFGANLKEKLFTWDSLISPFTNIIKGVEKVIDYFVPPEVQVLDKIINITVDTPTKGQEITAYEDINTDTQEVKPITSQRVTMAPSPADIIIDNRQDFISILNTTLQSIQELNGYAIPLDIFKFLSRINDNESKNISQLLHSDRRFCKRDLVNNNNLIYSGSCLNLDTYGFVVFNKVSKDTGKIDFDIQWGYPNKCEEILIDGKLQKTCKKTSIKDALKPVLDNLKSSTYLNEDMYNEAIEKLNSIQDKNISISIISPDVCVGKNDASFNIPSSVSFRSEINRKFFVDGEYTIRLSIDDPNSDKDLILNDIKINILEELDKKNQSLPPVSLKYIEEKKKIHPLVLDKFLSTNFNYSELEYSSNYINNNNPEDYVSYHLKNDTANMWDLHVKMNPIGACEKDVFSLTCMKSSEADIKMHKATFGNGVYNIWANYNKIPNNNYFKTNQYEFTISNVKYNSFVRLNDEPELYSTNLLNNYVIPDNYNSPLNISEIIGNSSSINRVDYNTDLPEQGDKEKYQKHLYDMYKFTTNKIASSISDEDKAKNSNNLNLFKDLIKPHSNSNMLFDSFNRVNFSQCNSGKSLHVGAVVDLTNSSSSLNNELVKKDMYIPLILAVVRKNDTLSKSTDISKFEVFRSWNFSAKSGSVSTISRYWDGFSDDIDSYVEEENNYGNLDGFFEVRIFPVEISNDMLDSKNLVRPSINSTSTKSVISFFDDENCTSDVDFVPEQLDYISSSLEEIEPMVLAVNWDEIHSISDGFGTAAISSTTTLEEAKAQLEKLFKQSDSLAKEVKSLSNKCKSGCTGSDKTRLSNNLKQLKTVSYDTLKAIEDIELKTGFSRKIKSFDIMFQAATGFFVVSCTGGLSGSVFAEMDRGLQVLRIEKNFKLAIKEALVVLEKSQSKDCIDNASPDKLKLIRAEIKNLINGRRGEYDEMIQARKNSANLVEFTKLADDLESKVSKIRIDFTSKKAVLDKECELRCDKDDFNPKPSNYFISDSEAKRTIKCRVKYVSFGKLRDILEKGKLKKYLEVTNTLRIPPKGETYGSARNNKTFGFAIITSISPITLEKLDLTFVYPLNISVKGVSGSDYTLDGFAPKLTDITKSFPDPYYPDNNINGRIFTVKTTENNSKGRGDDAEVRMLEEIARMYWKRETNTINPRRVNVEIFTDRKTCTSCDSLINRINNKSEQTNDYIKINTYVQGIVNSPLQGIFFGSSVGVENEKIPLMDKNFYLSIE